ncbi:cytosine permease [Mycobacterium sp. 236(2023)]|uniref:cytosine permease n=1 Tax=Mycobacterium sp. 236(2023) TaxID=3038163 RepID=UPI00241578EF|nr:cytosine permease [Mycobacterium sp. 236(2023)]MDG4665635.1 cytosine permease [Mycobacterium sp. 236(2023)]
MTVTTPAHPGDAALGEEYEHEPVPASARKSLFSVSAVWVGFPMIMTSAVFSGIVVYNLGFVTGIIAILVGDFVLMAYVGTLSYLAGRSGKNFALTAADTFGSKGFRIVSAFLSTLVIGWFAFQTGMVGSTLNASMGWSAVWITLLAGVLFVALTFVGIRAISWIGVIASALFIPLGVVAVIIAARDNGVGSAFSYAGGAGVSAFSFGVAVTMTIACFIDSGTMTADFTRWARNGKEGALAAFSAFPIAYFIAQLVGAFVVALGASAAAEKTGGDFLHVLVENSGVLLVLGVLFVFVNLGSVCAHCLYNGAVGFGHITGKTMRQLTIVLGVIGTAAAVAGIWSYFETWLSLLGVLVPPIGVIIILDQLVFAARRTPSVSGLAWKPFAAWGIGAVVALLTHLYAPQLSDAVVAMVVGGLAFTALSYLSGPAAATRTAEPVMSGESA